VVLWFFLFFSAPSFFPAGLGEAKKEGREGEEEKRQCKTQIPAILPASPSHIFIKMPDNFSVKSNF
jgi:hypothetical protein